MGINVPNLYAALNDLEFSKVLVSSKDGILISDKGENVEAKDTRNKTDVYLCAVAAAIKGMAALVPPICNAEYGEILRETIPESVHIIGDENTYQIHTAGEYLIIVERATVPGVKDHDPMTPLVEGNTKTYAEILGRYSTHLSLGKIDIPKRITLSFKGSELDILYPEIGEIIDNLTSELRKGGEVYGKNVVELLDPLKFGQTSLGIPTHPTEDTQIKEIIKKMLVK